MTQYGQPHQYPQQPYYPQQPQQPQYPQQPAGGYGYPQQPQYGPAPGYPPQQPYYGGGAQNIPQDIEMPAPRYGGDTDQALYAGNIEQELDNDQIMSDFHSGNMDKEDTYAQQVRMRAQQENHVYQQKIGALEQTNQTLSQDLNYLKGQVDTLTSTNMQASNQAAEQAEMDAKMSQFDLDPEEQQLAQDYGPVFQKMMGKALFLQERKLKGEFSDALATQTQAAINPLTERLVATQSQLDSQEQTIQNQFDIQLNSALGQRGVSLEGLLHDPEFRAYGNQRIEGSDFTRLKIMSEAAKGGQVAKVVEVVDGYFRARGYNTAAQAGVPQMGNTPRMHTPQEQQVLHARQQTAARLQQLEQANSVGDYSAFNGSRKAFMEERNKLLSELEQTPLPK